MSTVAAALIEHVPRYLETFGNRVPLGHRKVLSYITRCGTGELGDAFYKCTSCHKHHWIGRACGNRHCPNCQKQKTSAWLLKQTSKLLPVQQFVVTFTVPNELRSLLRSNQRAGYEAIFKAGNETIRKLLANDKNLGSDKIGFFGVLHTWGRDLKDYHPHVHFVVPGGGVSKDGKRWLQVKRDQLFHPAPARQLYKKLFVEQLKKEGLYKKLPYGVLKKDWVVNIKPVGNGGAVLKYLAPYVYRVAISDSRIVSVDSRKVRYLVKPSGKRRYRPRELSGQDFVQSFCQHILPSRLQKIRYYGFMNPSGKLKMEEVRWLVWMWKGWSYWLGSVMSQTPIVKPAVPTCRHCGGELELLAITNERGHVIWRKRLPHHLATRGPP